ncbi:MAG: hypothetical protein WCG99_03705 [Candidatus Berkelbacteria bacterium]
MLISKSCTVRSDQRPKGGLNIWRTAAFISAQTALSGSFVAISKAAPITKTDSGPMGTPDITDAVGLLEIRKQQSGVANPDDVYHDRRSIPELRIFLFKK